MFNMRSCSLENVRKPYKSEITFVSHEHSPGGSFDFPYFVTETLVLNKKKKEHFSFFMVYLVGIIDNTRLKSFYALATESFHLIQSMGLNSIDPAMFSAHLPQKFSNYNAVH